MKIAVPVKKVAVLDEDFELTDDGRGVDPDAIEWELNEWDSYSLEAALLLAESVEGSEVSVLTVGDEEAEEPLLGCLARGADSAVRIWDERLADVDSLAIASVLAAALRDDRPDLVLCGVQSSDAAHSATGIALAGLLGLPHVAVVKSLEIGPSGSTATVGRELEGGVIETVEVDLPALLTIQTGINSPRYATLRAIKQARAKPLRELDLEQLGLSWEQVEGAAGHRVRHLHAPDAGGRAEMIEGDAGEVAERIADLIKDRVGS
jgi:electron transfer flavoprotein beta subunit